MIQPNSSFCSGYTIEIVNLTTNTILAKCFHYKSIWLLGDIFKFKEIEIYYWY